MELYRSCKGDWHWLACQTDVSQSDLFRFLEYAALFLGNVGNYYGKGDQKFVPEISNNSLGKISTISDRASRLYGSISGPILALQPSSLGFPSQIAQSSYYIGYPQLTRDEIAHVSKRLEEHSIHPENTRIHKTTLHGIPSFEVLQGSVELNGHSRLLEDANSICLVRGDHSTDLERISGCFDEARKFTANLNQDELLKKYQECFRSGNMEHYKDAQRIWVKDLKPPVETIIGFVEPYRDPFGIRAEFEGLVGIVDSEETRTLTALAENSAKFICRLPWAENTLENDGKGPFEKDLFEAPDFTSTHALAYCSSIIFPGINLPNVLAHNIPTGLKVETDPSQYNDIRQEVGFKNLMISNSFSTQMSSNMKPIARCVNPSEAEKFLKHKEPTYYLWVVFHELLGHGTGKLFIQDRSNSFNFDHQNPPLNPLTEKSINCWYGPGQTWTGLFGDIATSVDECRAECVGAYLMSDSELLAMFGFSDETEITAADLEYNMYLQLGVAGLRALENYNEEAKKWGQAHSRVDFSSLAPNNLCLTISGFAQAHFAMFRCLLAAGDDFLTIKEDQVGRELTVTVKQDKISTHGRPALGKLLLRLHIYRCTADVKACRPFYEALTEPNELFLSWREIMLANQEPKQIFVQANTFVKDGQVSIKEYDATVEGMIQSWAERDI